MKKMKELYFSLIYFFGQGIQYLNMQNSYFIVGNFNIFYLGAVAELYKNRKNTNMLKKVLIPYIVSLCYLIIQALYSEYFNSFRAIINITKIFFCFLLMLYIKENYNKVSLIKIAKIVSIMSSILLVISLFFKDSFLWRNNDYINKFDLTRLQFFFLEPSELGFYLMIVQIILFAYIMYANFREKIMTSILIILNFLAIYFTKSIGTIAIGIFALIVMIIYRFVSDFTNIKNSKRIYVYLIGTIFALITSIILINGSLGDRLRSITSGTDSSVNYRLLVASQVTDDVLTNTDYIGIGYGNLELNYEKYAHYGLTESGIVSSFLNFISEGGMLSIFILVLLVYILIRYCIISNSILKWGLLIFIIGFQIVGSYFTNPLCWIIYGIIISDFTDKDLINI